MKQIPAGAPFPPSRQSTPGQHVTVLPAPTKKTKQKRSDVRVMCFGKGDGTSEHDT